MAAITKKYVANKIAKGTFGTTLRLDWDHSKEDILEDIKTVISLVVELFKEKEDFVKQKHGLRLLINNDEVELDACDGLNAFIVIEEKSTMRKGKPDEKLIHGLTNSIKEFTDLDEDLVDAVIEIFYNPIGNLKVSGFTSDAASWDDESSGSYLRLAYPLDNRVNLIIEYGWSNLD